MTGSARSLRRRRNVLFCFSERRKKERVSERKGLGISPDRRLADDRKRFYSEEGWYLTWSENRVGLTGSASTAQDVVWGRGAKIGFGEGFMRYFHRAGGRRMTGRAFTAKDVAS